MLPDPEVADVAPPVADAVQLSLRIAAGNASVTVAPTAASGPIFETTIV